MVKRSSLLALLSLFWSLFASAMVIELEDDSDDPSLPPIRQYFEQKYLKKDDQSILNTSATWFFKQTGLTEKLTNLTTNNTFTAEDLQKYIQYDASKMRKILSWNWGSINGLIDYLNTQVPLLLTMTTNDNGKLMIVWIIEDIFEGKNIYLMVRLKENGELTVEFTFLHRIGPDTIPDRKIAAAKFSKITVWFDEKLRLASGGKEGEIFIHAHPIGHGYVEEHWNHLEHNNQGFILEHSKLIFDVDYNIFFSFKYFWNKIYYFSDS